MTAFKIYITKYISNDRITSISSIFASGSGYQFIYVLEYILFKISQ